jgi:regulator of RNase E activity RraA
MTIATGDILHGDENGLVSVPRGREKEIAGAVDTVRSRERRLMDWVRSDKFNLEGFRDHVAE